MSNTPSKSKKKQGGTPNDGNKRRGKSPGKRTQRRATDSNDSLPQAEVSIRNIISRSTSSSRCLLRISRISPAKVTVQ